MNLTRHVRTSDLTWVVLRVLEFSPLKGVHVLDSLVNFL